MRLKVLVIPQPSRRRVRRVRRREAPAPRGERVGAAARGGRRRGGRERVLLRGVRLAVQADRQAQRGVVEAE